MNTTPNTSKRPVRVGVFADVASAEAALVRLLNAGFTKAQITIVAPESIKKEFPGFQVDEPGGTHTAMAVTAGGAAGAVLGGLIAAATVIASGGTALLVAGALVMAASGGAASGGFIGAMMSRGFDKEAAQFYDLALEQGKILVGVDYEGPGQREKLELAERVLGDAGAHPLPLREG